MTEEIARAERDGTTVAVLFLDLDEFKRVNDTWGHLAGSRTLREVGQLIGTAIPPGAVAARYGGDEFVHHPARRRRRDGSSGRRGAAPGDRGRRAFLTDAGEIGPGPAGLHVTGVDRRRRVSRARRAVRLARSPPERAAPPRRRGDVRVEVARQEPAHHRDRRRLATTCRRLAAARRRLEIGDVRAELAVVADEHFARMQSYSNAVALR